MTTTPSEFLTQLEIIVSKAFSKKLIFDKSIDLYRYRVTVPSLRALLKSNKSSFIFKSSKHELACWDYVWSQSNIFEIKSLALYSYQYWLLNKIEFKMIAKWVSDCSCWEHSDDLSKIIAQVTELNPGWSLPVLQKWNRSRNPWQRRQSLVGMIEYASKRKVVLPFETYIEPIKNLLNDSEYYVQKAVGWTLREVYNFYPVQTLKFITDHLIEISPIAYSASVEKLTPSKKEKLKKIRAQNRKNSND